MKDLCPNRKSARLVSHPETGGKMTIGEIVINAPTLREIVLDAVRATEPYMAISSAYKVAEAIESGVRAESVSPAQEAGHVALADGNPNSILTQAVFWSNSHEVRDLIMDSKPIRAIKKIRESDSSLSLVDAKRIVDLLSHHFMNRTLKVHTLDNGY
jgi:ribosomal protein L7/L12